MLRNERYSVFGLTMESQIPLPELYPAGAEAPVQVKIGLGQAPHTLDDALMKNPWWEVSQNAYLLHVEGIADYYVQNGETITIAPSVKASQEDIRVFLLTSVMAQLLHQRGVFVLHGSAALIQNKAVLFLGPTIAGKTSLALELYKQGYPILGDEFCAIRMVDGKAMIQPGIPRLAVWKDTLEKAGEEPAAYTEIRQGMHKYCFPVNMNFHHDVTEISDVIIMNSNSRRDIAFNTVSGAKKFKMIMQNVYQLDSKAYGSYKEKNYRHAVGIANCAQIHQLEFNIKLHPSRELAAFVVRELKEYV